MERLIFHISARQPCIQVCELGKRENIREVLAATKEGNRALQILLEYFLENM